MGIFYLALYKNAIIECHSADFRRPNHVRLRGLSVVVWPELEMAGGSGAWAAAGAGWLDAPLQAAADGVGADGRIAAGAPALAPMAEHIWLCAQTPHRRIFEGIWK